MSAPTFRENWFHPDSQAVLAGLVRDVADVPGRIVEIGAWEGRSTIAMANATDRTIDTVDTWQGSPTDRSGKAAQEPGRDVHATWCRNVEAATKGNVTGHHMGWREYRQLDDSPVALLFIDAEHTYREVADNIDEFLPLMSPGGIVCGDDAHDPEIMRAVHERFDKVELAAAMWVVRL